MQGVVAAPPRRIEALAYIVDRVQRSGTSPSYGEIGSALSPRVGKTRVRELIGELIEIGVIERPPASRRGIRIRDLERCRRLIGEALGTGGWHHAEPLGVLAPPPCTIEQLPLLRLVRHPRIVN